MSQAYADRKIIGLFGSNDLFALDERTGDIVWEQHVDMERLWLTNVPPTVSDDAVYIVDCHMRMHAHAIADGSPLWIKEHAPDNLLVYPMANGPLVFANLERDGIERLAPDTGESIWRSETYLPEDRSTVSANGSLLYGIDVSASEMAALDIETGETVWRHDGDHPSGKVWAYASDGHTLVIADEAGRLTGIDIATGDRTFRRDDLRTASAYPMSSHPIEISGGSVLIATPDRLITVVDLASGETIDQVGTTGIDHSGAPTSIWVYEDLLLTHVPRFQLVANHLN